VVVYVRREGPRIGLGGVGVGPEEGHLLMPRFFKKKGPGHLMCLKGKKKERTKKDIEEKGSDERVLDGALQGC
jgi:hypothetical protein